MTTGEGPAPADRPAADSPTADSPTGDRSTGGPSTAARPTGVAYEQARAAETARAADGGQAKPYDPLKLCVYATVALLAWLFGAWAVLGFAALGFAGYWRARRAGLTRSKCYLRDTRLVLAYLGLITLVAAAALVLPHTLR
ncbi:hypothetical protein [Microbispora bryophytorum]|uniref:hypothetical protein n=1 Tax=Microbispora bryophytorum TaxID=1460882 RepID=UPI0033C8D5CA